MKINFFNPNEQLLAFPDGSVMINDYGQISVLDPDDNKFCFTDQIELSDGKIVTLDYKINSLSYQEFIKINGEWKSQTISDQISIRALDKIVYVGDSFDPKTYEYQVDISNNFLKLDQLNVYASGSSIIPELKSCSAFNNKNIKAVTGSIFYKNLFYVEYFDDTGSYSVIDVVDYVPKYYDKMEYKNITYPHSFFITQLSKIRIRNYGETVNFYEPNRDWFIPEVMIDEIEIRSTGPQDDDIRIKIDGNIVKDERRNVGWYSGSITTFISGSSTVNTINWNWTQSGSWFRYKLNRTENNGNLMKLGSHVEIDHFDGWAAGWRMSKVQVTMSFSDGYVRQFISGVDMVGTSSIDNGVTQILQNTPPLSTQFFRGPHFISYRPITSFYIEK